MWCFLFIPSCLSIVSLLESCVSVPWMLTIDRCPLFSLQIWWRWCTPWWSYCMKKNEVICDDWCLLLNALLQVSLLPPSMLALQGPRRPLLAHHLFFRFNPSKNDWMVLAFFRLAFHFVDQWHPMVLLEDVPPPPTTLYFVGPRHLGDPSWFRNLSCIDDEASY